MIASLTLTISHFPVDCLPDPCYMMSLLFIDTFFTANAMRNANSTYQTIPVRLLPGRVAGGLLIRSSLVVEDHHLLGLGEAGSRGVNIYYDDT